MRSFAVLLGLAPWAQAVEVTDVVHRRLSADATKGTIKYSLSLGSIPAAFCKSGEAASGAKSTGGAVWNVVKDAGVAAVKALAGSATLENVSVATVTATHAAAAWQDSCHGTTAVGTTVALSHDFVYTYDLAAAVTPGNRNVKTLDVSTPAQAVTDFKTAVALAVKTALQNQSALTADAGTVGSKVFGDALAKTANADSLSFAAKPATTTTTSSQGATTADVTVALTVTMTNAHVHKCAGMKAIMAAVHGAVHTVLKAKADVASMFTPSANTASHEWWKLDSSVTGIPLETSVAGTACTDTSPTPAAGDAILPLKLKYIFTPKQDADAAQITAIKVVATDGFQTKIREVLATPALMAQHTLTALKPQLDAQMDAIGGTVYKKLKPWFNTAGKALTNAVPASIAAAALKKAEVSVDVKFAFTDDQLYTKKVIHNDHEKATVFMVFNTVAAFYKAFISDGTWSANVNAYAKIKKIDNAPETASTQIVFNAKGFRKADTATTDWTSTGSGFPLPAPVAKTGIDDSFTFTYTFQVEHDKKADTAKTNIDALMATIAAAAANAKNTVSAGSSSRADFKALLENVYATARAETIIATGLGVAGGTSDLGAAEAYTGVTYATISTDSNHFPSAVVRTPKAITVQASYGTIGQTFASGVLFATISGSGYSTVTCAQLGVAVTDWGRAAKNALQAHALTKGVTCTGALTALTINALTANVDVGVGGTNCQLAHSGTGVWTGTGAGSGGDIVHPILASAKCETATSVAPMAAGGASPNDATTTDQFWDKVKAQMLTQIDNSAQQADLITAANTIYVGAQYAKFKQINAGTDLTATSVQNTAVVTAAKPCPITVTSEIQVTGAKAYALVSCNLYIGLLNHIVHKARDAIALDAGVTSAADVKVSAVPTTDAGTDPLSGCGALGDWANNKYGAIATDKAAAAASNANFIVTVASTASITAANRAAELVISNRLGLLALSTFLPTAATLKSALGTDTIPRSYISKVGTDSVAASVTGVAYEHPPAWHSVAIGTLAMSVKIPAEHVISKAWLCFAAEMLQAQIAEKIISEAAVTANVELKKAKADLIIPQPTLSSALAGTVVCDSYATVINPKPSSADGFTVDEKKKNTDAKTYNVVYTWTNIQVPTAAYSTSADFANGDASVPTSPGKYGKHTGETGSKHVAYTAELKKFTDLFTVDSKLVKLDKAIRDQADTKVKAIKEAGSALIAASGGIAVADANKMVFGLYKPLISVAQTAAGKMPKELLTGDANCAQCGNDVLTGAENNLKATLVTSSSITPKSAKTTKATWTATGCPLKLDTATGKLVKKVRRSLEESRQLADAAANVAYSLKSEVTLELPATTSGTQVGKALGELNKEMKKPAFATNLDAALDAAVKASQASGSSGYDSAAKAKVVDLKGADFKATVSGLSAGEGATVAGSTTAANAVGAGLSALVGMLAAVLMFA